MPSREPQKLESRSKIFDPQLIARNVVAFLSITDSRNRSRKNKSYRQNLVHVMYKQPAGMMRPYTISRGPPKGNKKGTTQFTLVSLHCGVLLKKWKANMSRLNGPWNE